MRLGDLDDLKDHISELLLVYSGTELDNAILNAIDNAPTVKERPKGKWMIDGHHIRCNRCNEYICNTDREGNKIPDNFCPNCGARMDR